MYDGMTLAAADFAARTTPHLDRLFRLGLRLTHEPAESADLVQEALCRAWASWSTFDPHGSLGAYLSKIVFNTFVSRHRHACVVAKTAAREDLVEHLYDSREREAACRPEGQWHDQDFSDEVRAALRGLPLHYRAVIELVDLDGLPYKDAAARLDLPVGTVMSRLHRARRRLRLDLAEYARTLGMAA